MNNPEEKAKELIEKFGRAIMENTYADSQEERQGGIACAITCIETMIKEFPFNKTFNDSEAGVKERNWLRYWTDVKWEIQKLSIA